MGICVYFASSLTIEIINVVDGPPAESFDKDFGVVIRTGDSNVKIKTKDNEDIPPKLITQAGDELVRAHAASAKAEMAKAEARAVEAKAKLTEAEAKSIKYAAAVDLMHSASQIIALLSTPVTVIALAR